MRKLKLLLAALCLLIGGGNNAWSYSTSDLTTAGWTQVTDLSSLTLADNYFVLVDANASATAVAVGNPATADKPAYTTLTSPFAAAQQVWIIETSGSGYKLQNIVNNKYINSGNAGWNDSMNNTGTELTFTLNDGKYKISCGTGHAGPWNNNGAVSLSDGYENIALNKSESQAPGFFIYNISRTAYNAARRNGAKLATEGWSQVTATAGLGLSGYYYALLDVSEAGYESGFAITGATGGRPQSQALTDPTTNKAQLWTIASHDAEKYVLQCAQDNKYFRCDGAGWNTGFTDNIDADGTDFTFTLNDGKWTLANEKDAGNFVGRWANSVFHPFQGESIAANKAAGSGKKQYLIYSIPTIAGVATELPANGDMAADTWYYIDIAAAANNYLATATTLDDIVYSTDPGNTLVKNLTESKFTAENNELLATRYYVKSSSANNLKISVASYTYVVGTATVDINYIQPGNTVTITYAELGTNDPSSTVANIDFSGVTFGGNSIDVTPTANGFTFTVPAVTAATAYTLAIPAGAIGYAAGSTYNAAQEITLKTPVLFDGNYFLKIENEGGLKGQYLSRGKNYGTHMTADKYGLAIKVATDGQNKTTLKPFDTDRFYRMSDNGYECWADNTDNDNRAKFNIIACNSPFDGKFYIHGITAGRADDYFKYNNGDIGETTKLWADSHGTDGSNGFAIQFSAESGSAHATVMQALKDSQAAAAAAAAYASGNYASLNGITTVAALEAELTANYIQGDFVAPSPIESISEKYQGAQPGSGNTVETVYSNTIEITAPGFYKFSMQAFYRAGSNDRTQDMHTANLDFPPVVLFFGDSQTQIKSVYDDGGLAQGIAEGYFETETVGGVPVEYNGKYYTNGQHNSVIIFQKDYYHNDVWLYVETPGTYTYGVKYLGYANANSQWFIYSPESVTITSYAAAADATDYANLADAIDAYESVTWGFEDGEYAPYANTTAIANYTAAKAINPSAVNSKLLVQSLTSSLETLTANDGEVNAVNNGNFATKQAAETGWVFGAWGEFVSGLNTNTNASNGTARSSNAGNLTYGNLTGYTMPLKASTVYRLTFKVASWDDSNKNTGTDVSVLNSSSEGLATKSFEASGTNRDQYGAFKTYTTVFTTGAAGDYTLVITAKGTRSVYTDIVLKKAVAEEITIAETETYTPTEKYANVTFNRTLVEGWNGLVLPFDMSVDDVKSKFNATYVMDFNDIDYDTEKGVTLKFTNATDVKAGRPFLLKAAAGNSYTINDVILPATNLQTVVKADATHSNITYTMTGTYAATTDLTDVNFALVNGGYYYYHNAGVNASSAKAFRAYFVNNSTEPGAARVMFDFGESETTGIQELKQQNASNAQCYDLMGRKVANTNKKGFYIQNGKKVVK